MFRILAHIAVLAAIVTLSVSDASGATRVPPEWEPQEAVWMQWPKGVESSYRPNFAGIIDALQEYAPINILVASTQARDLAQNFLTNAGVPLTNIEWHIMSYDWAWMRDNGPVWVEVDGQLQISDWAFDGWGQEVPYWGNDDAVPCQVASVVGVTCQTEIPINERGTLEFNGAGALITSWVVLNHRNPGITQTQWEEMFLEIFGVTQTIWLTGSLEDDFTRGHTDGIARFIDENTVAVGRYVDQGDPDAVIYEDAATTIQNAGFEVVRVDIPGYVTYRSVPMAADYMNWLLVDGLVLVGGFDHTQWDNAAKAEIELLFPGRDVLVTDIRELWYWGGGVHCVTNDQPVAPDPAAVADPTDTDSSHRLRLEPNRPNPFSPATTLSFRTQSDGTVRLDIYDASGAAVRHLLTGTLAAGMHRTIWDGTDDDGRPVASGPYFSVLHADGTTEKQKITLVR